MDNRPITSSKSKPASKGNSLEPKNKEDSTNIKLPLAMTPTPTSSHHPPTKSMTFAMMNEENEGLTPTSNGIQITSPQFTSTPILTSGNNGTFLLRATDIGGMKEEITSQNKRVPTTTNSVVGSVAVMSVNSPYQMTSDTTVYIYIDDLIISAAELNKNNKFDESLTKQKFAALRNFCNPILLTSTVELEYVANKMLEEKWAEEFQTIVSTKPVKETTDELRKGSVKLVISDELFFKQSTNVRSEAIASGGIVLFASLFTKNESWAGIDYQKVSTGRGAGNILSKLIFSHIKDRTLVGLFIEGSYFNPKLVSIFEDLETVNFVPVLFNDIPAIEFDYLLQRVNTYKAKIILGNEQNVGNAKKIFDNYTKYEDKCKNCVIIDKFEWSKAMMYRSEFMEVLKEHCEIENTKIDREVFQTPWTRSGDYLDVLNNQSTDSMIAKLCNSIPYPLITKSDLACGHPHTHLFMIIKERPEDWTRMKETIGENYMNKPFIVQSYVSVDDNLVLKAMYFLGEFSYDVREGLNHQAASKEIESGTFLEQNTKSVKKDSKAEIEEVNDDGTISPQNNSKTQVDPDIIELIKSFTISLAQRMKLYLVGIDFLVLKKGNNLSILPIDLNKMPRPDKIEGFRENLLRHCNTKSSFIQLTPEE